MSHWGQWKAVLNLMGGSARHVPQSAEKKMATSPLPNLKASSRESTMRFMFSGVT